MAHLLKIEISGFCSASKTNVAKWLAECLEAKGMVVEIDTSKDDKDCVRGMLAGEHALVAVKSLD